MKTKFWIFFFVLLTFGSVGNASPIGSLAKLILRTSRSTVSAVPAKSVMALSRSSVLESGHRLTAVYMMDGTGNLEKRLFVGSAAEISNTLEDLGVEVMRLHDGVFVTGSGLENSEALITKKSVYLNPYSQKDAYEIALKDAPTGRTGVLKISSDISLPVSKLATPRVKSSLESSNFSRKIRRPSPIILLIGLAGLAWLFFRAPW